MNGLAIHWAHVHWLAVFIACIKGYNMSAHPVNRAAFNRAYAARSKILGRLSSKLVSGRITVAQYNARVQRINIWAMRYWDK